MSHELEMVNGKAQMAYVGEVPWHGLGTEVPADLSPQEIMQAAGLDWRVKLVPTFAETFINGERTKIATDMKALVRESDGKLLTTVGRRWYPVQNEDAFDFFTKFVEAGNMQMHTAGSLKGGEVVWAMAKLTDKFELFGGDVVEGNLLFTNPHQYGKGIDVRFTPIRVVCNNTLVLAQSKAAAQAVKMDHRTVFDAEKVTDMLNIASLKMSQYKEMASFIGSRKAERSVMEEYFGELLGRDKKDEKELSRNGKAAMAAIDVQPGAEYAQGTWWTAFNAITYMTDHVMGYRPDTRLQSAWYGPNLNLKYKALQKAVEYAAKSPDIERKVAA